MESLDKQRHQSIIVHTQVLAVEDGIDGLGENFLDILSEQADVPPVVQIQLHSLVFDPIEIHSSELGDLIESISNRKDVILEPPIGS